MKLSATIIGLVTGLLMVGVGLFLALSEGKENTAWQYLGTFIYGLGIVWSIVSYASQNRINQFGALFQQGFKCFVVATLILAIYTFAYWKLNPQKIDSIIEQSKIERIKTAKDRTLDEINLEAKQTKKYFIPFNISGLIFSNLFIGAVVAMVTAGTLHVRNKNQ